ncbi:hypothetical protein M413DRAFT_447461 [Hebeloma cylindrosporum]|uniref:F-box domain-containing protein n=1 Tax=Hebeloma cylindrosporum TaxID=76867 RepID=A0A0C3C6C3_HEBCY|nr:hypothetical protein M413DRAFT_447461 [Hebeloma cylindrosporum h7]
MHVATQRLGALKQGIKPWAQLVVNRQDDLADVRRKLEDYHDDGLLLDVCVRLPDVEHTRSLTKLLRQHVPRFRTLHISVPAHEDAEKIVSSIGEGQPAPLLERLNITVEQKLQYPIPYFEALKNAFYPSPRLIHLSLPSNPLPEITIPHLSTVTSLMIDSVQAQWGIHLSRLCDMLESMPHLQHFTFKGSDNFSFCAMSRLDHPRVISMPNLVSMDVSAPGCGLDILRALDAPLLDTVRFNGYRPLEYQEDFEESLTIPIPASLRRVSERSPKLTRLELRSTVMHNPLDDHRWLFSVEAFPQLEVLRLNAADISDDALLMGVGQVRNLKRIELINCEDVSGQAVQRFVQGRDKDFTVLVVSCPSITQEDLMELTETVIVESK